MIESDASAVTLPPPSLFPVSASLTSGASERRRALQPDEPRISPLHLHQRDGERWPGRRSINFINFKFSFDLPYGLIPASPAWFLVRSIDRGPDRRVAGRQNGRGRA